MTHKTPHLSLFFLLFFALLTGATSVNHAQQLSSFERERGRMMLGIIKDDLKEHYYDATFHGVNVDESFKTAEEKIKQATSNSQVFSIIAQTLMQLNDSHTFFLPPPRGFKVEYGWKMQVFGDACYVSVVKPGSDAEKKGLKPGDLIKVIDGFTPTRQNAWILNYLFHGLSPRSAQRLLVQSPGGEPRELEIASQVTQGQKLLDLTMAGQQTQYKRELEQLEYLSRHRFQELGKELLIWKMPQFDLTEKELEGMMKRIKSFPSVILDLRGNGGGYLETLRHMVGYFNDGEVKIADVKSRKETKPMMSKKVGAFEGKFVILVDSDSASCAEIFPRVMQILKRAVIIGDRTAGAVMMSRHYQREMGTDSVVFYGTSITEADVIMSDGKSLEHTGLIPDELLIPTPEDLLKGRDPVLARAAEILGFKLDAEKAGKLFPIEWPRPV